MKPWWMRNLSRLLILALLPLQPIQAALVPTEQLVALPQEAPEQRTQVGAFLARADVAAQLQALGVSPDEARERVDALTDQEVQRIAGHIDTLPAGGLLLELLLVALIAWLVYLLVVK